MLKIQNHMYMLSQVVQSVTQNVAGQMAGMHGAKGTRLWWAGKGAVAGVWGKNHS